MNFVHKIKKYNKKIKNTFENQKIKVYKKKLEKYNMKGGDTLGGLTLLIKAIKNNDYENFINLIENEKKDINEKDYLGLSPFINACLIGNYEMVKYLFDKVDIHQTDNNGKQAFIYAIYGKNLDIIKLFLDNGINISF